jgi:hypothetical protein
MTALGVTDPRTWGVVGWISDLIAHFGYGVVTTLLLHYLYPLSRPSPRLDPPRRAGLTVVGIGSDVAGFHLPQDRCNKAATCKEETLE